MRPIFKTMMCTFLAAAVAAPTWCASPAYLKLGGVDGESTKGKHGHKDEIEILSWSWGASNPVGSGGGAGKVNVHDISIMRSAAKGEKGGTEDINIGVGELQEAPAGGVRVAAGDVTGDGRADIVSPRDAASGMPTGKRQHGWVKLSKPLDRGAVRIKVKLPWMGCAVGARYPSLTLGGGDGPGFELTDAVVTSCGSGSSSGESLPMEEVSFNYAKVKVRAWDPAKKE